MRDGGPLSLRTGGILAAVGLIAFGAASAATVFGDSLPTFIVQPSAYSESALGHRALFDHLDLVQPRPVVTLRRASVQAAADSALYILAEPAGLALFDAGLVQAESAARVLVVLPKRAGVKDQNQPNWISRDIRRSDASVVLRRLEEEATLQRADGDVAWTSAQGLAAPQIADPQLIADWTFDEALLESAEGVLVGVAHEDAGRRIMMIADPDLLANHGLDDGENAAIATRLITDFAQGDGAIIFDETIHGFTRELSIWRRLFSFPYIIVALGGLLAVAAAAWAAASRFGPAAAEDRARLGGRLTLIRSAAALTLSAGHGVDAFQQYADAKLKQAAQLLKPPRRLRDARLTAWLDEAAEARGLTPFSEQRRRIAAVKTDAEARALATGIHHWVQEFDNGYERGGGAGREGPTDAEQGGRRP